ncbi:MAG: NAD-dependent DNA ligase LigA [Rhodothermales bacterium]
MDLINRTSALRRQLDQTDLSSLSREEAESLASDLRAVLNEHAHQYYVLDDPQIADPEYDRLFRSLQELEQHYPSLVRPDSPTRRVGGAPLEQFRKVRHPEPLLSLSNAFNADELRAWYERCLRLLAQSDETASPALTVEPKIDGIALALTYERGELVTAATRGNGVEGEDVTAQARTIQDIPLRIPVNADAEITAPSRLEVRGEAYMRTSEFEQMNERQAARGERLYANPRNSTAGSIRQLDPKITASRPLRFFAYSVGPIDGTYLPGSQLKTLAWLKRLGFPVNEWVRRFEDIDAVIAYCERWITDRSSIDYDIDGVVVKIDWFDYQRLLGNVSNAPRWAVAFKFPAQLATTHLQRIDVSVGRTGAVKPVAILEPVHIGGVTVSKATLHNEAYVRDRDILVGDLVNVKRAGDVIPQVIGPVVSARTGDEKEWRMPHNCPACDQPLVHAEGDADYYCVSADCPAQLVRSIEHFAMRGAMDIEGLGSKLAGQLVEQGLVHNAADIYRLSEGSLIPLDGFGAKKTENLLAGIEASKGRSLTRLIYALGIRLVGRTTAELLVGRFNSLADLRAQSANDLVEIDGVGPEIAESIASWFDVEANQNLVSALQGLGVNTNRLPEEAPPDDEDAPLAGKTFVLTGALPNYSRTEATELIRMAGGSVTGSVSKATDFLVAGDAPGSKKDRAEQLGIPVIDETALLRLLNND